MTRQEPDNMTFKVTFENALEMALSQVRFLEKIWNWLPDKVREEIADQYNTRHRLEQLHDDVHHLSDYVDNIYERPRNVKELGESERRTD